MDRLADAGVFSRRGVGCLARADTLEPFRRAAARRFTAEVERHDGSPDPLAVRLARAATSPWPGLPLLLVSTLALFTGVVLLGGWLSTLLSDAWAAWVSPLMTGVVTALLPVPVLGASVLWALDSGLLAMLAVGIPYVLVFTLALAALEDSGYLTSAANTCSTGCSRGLGLPGRAAIPLLTAAGCNVRHLAHGVLRTQREQTLGVPADTDRVRDFLDKLCRETWKMSDDWRRGPLAPEIAADQLEAAAHAIAEAFRRSGSASTYYPCHRVVLSV